MSNKALLFTAIFLGGLGCTRVMDSVDKKSHQWNEYESEHYVYYILDGSEAEQSIDQIQTEQEWAYQEINNRLSLNFERKLQVYIYNSRQDMGETDRTGKAYPEIGTIEAVYSSEAKSIGVRGTSFHELSHIVAFYEWCPVTEPLFAEGLAVWLDDYWKDSEINTTNLFRISKIRLQEGTLPGVEKMMTNWGEIDSRYSYPAAGSFTKYLIQEYGLNSFRQLYCKARKHDFDTVFFDIYDKEFWEVESEYEAFLKNL